MALLLGYPRGLWVASAPALALAQGPLEDCRLYLWVERGLSEHTVLDAYGPTARLLLAEREGADGLGLERLCPADVSSFLARECPRCSNHAYDERLYRIIDRATSLMRLWSAVTTSARSFAWTTNLGAILDISLLTAQLSTIRGPRTMSPS